MPRAVVSRQRFLFVAFAWALAGCGATAASQSDAHTAEPAPPLPPASVARDATGRVTVRATRVTEAIVLDGRLDEPAYERVQAIGDFVQQEPIEGQPATEKTDVWILFDDKNIYVSARCWDSHPEREISNEMRRDAQAIQDNEVFGVAFDTFYDRRNGYLFVVNASGGLIDAQVVDERDYNRDWNTIWDGRTARDDKGWTVEIAIPFKSLRYKSGQNLTWGVNLRRMVRWKNETSLLTRVSAAFGRRGLWKASSYASLVGIEAPSKGRNLELKPFAIADLTTDRTTPFPISNKLGGDAGLDVKMGVTQGLTADFTYNTDFAQVEVDDQQINLTRFNVFFPEKRDFFLEGQGIFAFGGLMTNPHNAIGPGGVNNLNPSPIDVPSMFFSRQIGLTNRHKIPIEGGARVTGKTGPYSVGLLDIRTGEEETVGVRPTNFGVVRIKRDLLRRSAVGALYTGRSISSSGHGSNQLFGVDGVFSFYENLSISTYLAKTSMEGAAAGDDLSYRAQLDYNADRYGLQLEQLFLDDRFNPDAGFVRRTAFRRNSAFVRYGVRQVSMRAVRKINFDSTFDYITDTSGQLQSRNFEAAVRGELQNGDSMAVEYGRLFESLKTPFAVAKDVTIPVGGYGFSEIRLMYWFGGQRSLASGIVKLERGSFYNGTRTDISIGRGRMEVTPQMSIEPNFTVDRVELPEGAFSTTLMSVRASYTFNPRIALSGLTQYNSTSRSIETNIRLRWEYVPGSDVYVVYTDSRDTLHPGFPMLQGRGLVVKVTRLFRL